MEEILDPEIKGKTAMKKLLLIFLVMTQNVFAQNSKSANKTVEIKVTDKGFEPDSLKVLPGTDLTLNVTRTTDQTCAKEIAIPSKKISEKLPLNKTVKIRLGKLEKGEVKFACGMNMIRGVILVE